MNTTSTVKPLASIKPGMIFKAKRRVTDQLIKLEDNVEYLVRFDEAMYRGENHEKPKEGVVAKLPPMLCRVTMLDSGEVGVIIVPLLLERDLRHAYPDDAYVGLMFAIQKQKISTKGGQSVNVFQIVEIEEDAETAPEVEPHPQASAEPTETVGEAKKKK